MIKKQHYAILLMVICTVFTSLGQVLWKYGLQSIDFSIPLTFLNIPFILGFVSYGLGALLMIKAFRFGELSVLYPIIATSYVWVSLLSMFLFGDVMNIWKWSGVTIIILSVSVIGFGTSKSGVAA